MRAILRLSGVIAVLAVLAPAWPQQLAADPAVTAVSASLEVEQLLLEEDRGAWEGLVARRGTVNARIAQLQQALDGAVTNQEPRAAELIERLSSQLDQVEGERAELQSAGRVLLDNIRDRLRRITLLEERLVLLRARPEPVTGALTGTWEVVLLPSNQHGAFELTQTGTIVAGTYTLAGGFSGSLRGTLVNTKVYLERIDSRMGRSMDFEGRLSADRTQIRGTWQSFELAEGDGAAGQWSARRVDAAGEPGAGH